ncbi:MAG TPA: protein phosphatase 2C domain-containing protein [Woeseiaceae bacterium]
MDSESATVVGQMVLLDGGPTAETQVVEIGGGSMVAYTCRSPDKETDNEDTVAAIPYGPDAAVLVVADGAGGLPAGRRASRTAVSRLEASLQTAMSETMLLRTAILNGIDEANRAVLELGGGSATTLTVVTIEGSVARTYQIGDSEAIIVGQRGKVKAQTLAHSPTGFAVEAGFLDQREALHHEERHLVSNFLGSSDMRIDMGATVMLSPFDTVLVASDGLTDNLHFTEIVEVMRKGSLQAAAEGLTRLAKRRMTVESKTQPSKPDDLSLILFRKRQKRRNRPDPRTAA